MGEGGKTLRERFDEKWIGEPTSGCWIWTAAVYTVRNLQYGVIGIGSDKTYAAHRVSWGLFRGQIPEHINVLHKCDVSLCVNPNHLFLGTQRDNVIDMVKKGRQRVNITNALQASHAAQRAKTHCKHGHPFDRKNLFIQQNGARGCRQCRLIRSQKHRARKKERELSNG